MSHIPSLMLNASPALLATVQKDTPLFAVHEVKAGDSMDSIARRHNIDPAALLKFNVEHNCATLEEGDRNSQTDLAQIVLQNHADDKTLARLKVILQPGQPILVPMEGARCALNTVASSNGQNQLVAVCNERQIELKTYDRAAADAYQTNCSKNERWQDVIQGWKDRSAPVAPPAEDEVRFTRTAAQAQVMRNFPDLGSRFQCDALALGANECLKRNREKAASEEAQMQCIQNSLDHYAGADGTVAGEEIDQVIAECKMPAND